MAGPLFFDRVRETTTTTGTGTITLAGAVSGYITFATRLSNGDTVYYCIAHRTANEWEVGTGTFTLSGTTLDRSVYSSSNSNNLVNFSAGTKDVFIVSHAGAISITGLTAETAIADGDEIAIYDASAVVVRKMTRANFLLGITEIAQRVWFSA